MTNRFTFLECSPSSNYLQDLIWDSKENTEAVYGAENQGFGCIGFEKPEYRALIVGALNTHEATGLTPQQLADRVAELEEQVDRLKNPAKYMSDSGRVLLALLKGGRRS